MGLIKLLKELFGEVELDQSAEKDSRMHILEAIDGFRWRYFNEIKPLIQKGYFAKAHLEINEIRVYLEMFNEDVWTKVHSGPNYLISMQQLCGYLQKGEDVPEEIIEQFEGYQAQTRLPLK